MKEIIYLMGAFAILFIGVTLNGCATPTQGISTEMQSERDQQYTVDHPMVLSDFLRKAPGVNLDWTTGVPTLRGGYPLYVIDGMRVGHDYYEVTRMVNVFDIASVEVIKSSTEALMYGRDVAHGVIHIHTRTGPSDHQ
ncbi:MAG: Plug domain-containing protein [Saprospiraceae bacterium]|nr:Plug domain-containing protein [Saprospiraceae bacterium]